MSDHSNPYVSPAHGGTPPANDYVDVPNKNNFGTIIRRWERLRILYCAVLIVQTLAQAILITPSLVAWPGFWLAVLFGAFVANLCFFIGPALEVYGTYFGFWKQGFTIVLFVLGLMLTSLLAFVSIHSLNAEPLIKVAG
jgi:hypothetical protein